MSYDPWWFGEPPVPRGSRRDPRTDDPNYYRERGGEWVKRAEWSSENAPDPLGDWGSYSRYVVETTPAQRQEHRYERMRRQGLVRWKDLWVTPERAKELDQQEIEAMKRRFEQQRQLEEMRLRLPSWWPWC